MYSRGVLLSALVDYGNLFADLISEKLGQTLSLKISGTALAKGSVTVFGTSETISDIFR